MRFVADDLFSASRNGRTDGEDQTLDFLAAIDIRHSEAVKLDDATVDISDDGEEAEPGCLEVGLFFEFYQHFISYPRAGSTFKTSRESRLTSFIGHARQLCIRSTP